MQRYSVGTDTTSADWLAAIPGLKPSQLTLGISGEGPQSFNAGVNGQPATLDSVVASYKAGVNGDQYGGMWMWRLNSDNDKYENRVQVILYNAAHGKTLPNSPDYATVKNWWWG